MATTTGTVRYYRAGDAVTFHVSGRGVMPHGLPMRQVAERLIDDGVRRVFVDLRDCTYMDSTFIGTLLTIRKRLDARGAGPLTLVAPAEACVKIFQEMGLTDHIPSEALGYDDSAGWTELKTDNADAGSFRRNVAQAHEELAALPGPAGEQFQAVVRCLSQTKPPAE